MDIDHSRAKAFRSCPGYYFERYEAGIERDYEKLGEENPFAFGKRVHQLLEERLKGKRIYEASAESTLEAEAQVMMAAYEANYPEEEFEVVEVERTFKVPLNYHVVLCECYKDHPCEVCKSTGYRSEPKHNLVGKFDGIIRYRGDGRLAILEHKTEKRGSLNNSAKAWASKAQVGLYLWAAQSLYGEEFKDILLDVLTRGSEKGKFGPSFSRQHLQRTSEQMNEVVEDIIYVADQIEEMQGARGKDARWPYDRDNCYKYGKYPCPYVDIHLFGKTPELMKKFKQAEEYLEM